MAKAKDNEKENKAKNSTKKNNKKKNNSTKPSAKVDVSELGKTTDTALKNIQDFKDDKKQEDIDKANKKNTSTKNAVYDKVPLNDVRITSDFIEDELMNSIREYANDILTHPNFLVSKTFRHHGTVSVMNHSLRVAKRSLVIARKKKMNVDECSLVRGALLHDYFGYDWHDKAEEHKGHATEHPRRALERAEKDFQLNDIEKDIILNHMYPLTADAPETVEGQLVSKIDKSCSLLETVITRWK